MSANKILAVIRREYTERVRTKAFVITTVLMPVFLVIAMLMPMLMLSGASKTRHIALLDAGDSGLGARIATALGSERLDDSKGAARYTFEVVKVAATELDARRDALVAHVDNAKQAGAERLDGVLVLPADALASGRLAYYGANVSSPEAMERLKSSLSDLFAQVRLGAEGVDAALVKRATERVHLAATKVSDGKTTGQSGVQSFLVAYAMGFILYLAVLVYGQQTMVSVIEEKNNRIMEVLTSALTPFQMLMGKVLGVGLAGLTQMGIWAAAMFLLSHQQGALVGAFGADPAALGDFALPQVSGSLLLVFLLYFLTGFLLYGALYAAIGAVCNTVQETQQYGTLVTLFILVGFFAVFALIANPDATVGRVFSWIPFFAPFTMPVRWSMVSVPGWELALSMTLMLLGLVACVWLAARIYRTGILMYGKRPGWKELWRWIRA